MIYVSAIWFDVLDRAIAVEDKSAIKMQSIWGRPASLRNFYARRGGFRNHNPRHKWSLSHSFSLPFGVKCSISALKERK